MPSNEVSFTVDFKNVKLVKEIINKFTDEATRLEERNGILYSHIELLNKALDVLCPLVARTIDFLPSEQFTLIAATREALDNVTYIQNKEYRENTNRDYYKQEEKIMTNQNTNCDYCKGVEKSVVDKSALVRLCGVLGVLTENNDLATAALLAATRIERLEKKIPVLNVDLAEASMNAYNSEIARMKLEAELARRDARIAELEQERRWIPVSERLPEYGEPSLTIYHTKNATSQITIRCLVEDRDDKLRVIWYDIENGLWVNGNNITHWMPLPEPPEDK